MDQFQQVLINFAIMVIPVVGAFIVNFLRKKNAELDEKIKNTKVEKYLGILFDTVEASVVAVQNTFVDNLKKNNSFDEEAQNAAFEDAKDRILTILSEDAKVVLNNAYGDLDELINGLIEKAVKDNK